MNPQEAPPRDGFSSKASAALLTIIIPTYNRAACLSMLLKALKAELVGLEGLVDVVIGDNASSDDTQLITKDFTQNWAATQILRHAVNLGADENFCRCVERAQGRYFWIIGDDDLPRAGTLRALLPLLEPGTADLVYLNSRWTQTLEHNEPANPLSAPLDGSRMNRATFARRVHVWTSFISGCIVRRSLAPDGELRRYTGSNLVQLGWVLRAIQRGQEFVYVRNQCVFATAGNTGGYSLLKVFGQNFQRITREMFSVDRASKRIAAAIILRTSLGFLPDLVWGFRQATLGRFDRNENVSDALRPELGNSLVYQLLIRPLEHAPVRTARVLIKCSHLLATVVRVCDVARARATGGSQRL